MANDCEDQTRPKSRRRWLFAGGIVLTLAVVALASWQYSARPSGATSPSLRWAKASCLTQVVGNASQLVPTGKATTVVVFFEHLRPLNGKKEGTTWIVLKNGAAESGYWCALGDDADFAESGPVATLIRPKHPLVQRAAYIGSTDRVGYVGLVARVPSSVSRVIIVTATGSTVVKPVAEQLGHASIRVTKDVYGHLLPRSRARAAEAMRSVLFDDEASSCPQESDALATQSATPRVANRCSSLRSGLSWAARVSIPAPWDRRRRVRCRPSRSVSAAQRRCRVRCRSLECSRVRSIGYKCGYTNAPA